MLAAVTYLSWLGGRGVQELSQVNFERGQELEKMITAIPGFMKVFSGVHFNEFVIRCPDAKKLHKQLLHKGIHGGLLLEQWYPELVNCMLFGITELHSVQSVQRLASLLKEVR
jgi:glycine dehydrogenase subunit 1